MIADYTKIHLVFGVNEKSLTRQCEKCLGICRVDNNSSAHRWTSYEKDWEKDPLKCKNARDGDF